MGGQSPPFIMRKKERVVHSVWSKAFISDETVTAGDQERNQKKCHGNIRRLQTMVGKVSLIAAF
jgi:hypothetical protein